MDTVKTNHIADELNVQVPEAPRQPHREIQRRSGVDRRAFTARTLITCLISPRRSRGRRASDRKYPMLDVFDSSAMLLAVTLMLLSLADAFFTLNILARGGEEVNPVMNYVLQFGTFAFVAVKVVLTAIPAVVLVASGNYKLFGVVRVRSILAAAIGAYAGLVLYEIGLLTLVA